MRIKRRSEICLDEMEQDQKVKALKLVGDLAHVVKILKVYLPGLMVVGLAAAGEVEEVIDRCNCGLSLIGRTLASKLEVPFEPWGPLHKSCLSIIKEIEHG